MSGVSRQSIPVFGASLALKSGIFVKSLFITAQVWELYASRERVAGVTGRFTG